MPNFRIGHSPPGFDCPFLLVKDLMLNGVWNLEGISQWVFEDVVNAIRAIPFSSSDAPDKLVWAHGKDGCFSVKDGYKVIRVVSPLSQVGLAANSSFKRPDGFWNVIWKVKCPPKVNHFLWRVCCQ